MNTEILNKSKTHIEGLKNSLSYLILELSLPRDKVSCAHSSLRSVQLEAIFNNKI